MNILILTKDGKGLGLAHRLKSEGHDIFIYSLRNLDSCSEMFTISSGPWEHIKDVKFIIADSPDWARIAKKAFETFNRPVIGEHELLGLANLDAVKQHALFDRFGVVTPRTIIFNDMSEAYQASIDWDAKRTLIKYGDVELKCNYRDWLAWGLSKIPVGVKVMFQEYPLGYEYIVSGWFNGFEWIDLFSVSPNVTGPVDNFCMAHIVSADRTLVKETLLKLAPFLKSLEYHGPASVKVCITKDKILTTSVFFGLEYPYAYSLLELTQENVCNFLYNIAFGLAFEPRKTKDYVSVVQASCMSPEFFSAPILGLNEERMKHLVFHNVFKKDENYYIAKGREIFTAVAHGQSPLESSDRVYRTVEGVKFPEKAYGSNLLSVSQPYFTKLHEWEYI